MMKKTLSVAILILSTFIFAVTVYSYSENIVASLDDENVTVEILTAYVEDVAGSKYEPWLHNKDGLRNLADFYINRTLLLAYAKKTIDKNDTIVTNHNARKVDADAMYLTALLQKEVQDKVNITDEAVSAYMQKTKSASAKQARQEIESNLKNELMTALIEKVRVGHDITYFF